MSGIDWSRLRSLTARDREDCSSIAITIAVSAFSLQPIEGEEPLRLIELLQIDA
jgi:hypothetical protein